MNVLKKYLESYISGKKKFFGLNIAPWVATGGLSIVATLIGNVPLSVASDLITLITGCPSSGEIWKKRKKIFKERNELMNSPVGLFFDLKN